MKAAAEIELKLELRPQDVRALKAHPLLKGAVCKTARQTSIYLDTTKGKLRKAGLTLRVRRAGRRFVQTVKSDAGPSAGLFERGEWEQPVASALPDLAALAGSPAERVLGKAPELHTQFETRIARSTWQLAGDGWAAEVVVDRGELVADAASTELSEVELELRSGAPADLFALARTLSEAAPLRLGVLAKSERGFLLRDGAQPGAVKAEPIAVSRGMTAAEGFQAIAAGCIRHFRRNEPRLLAARDGAALHQARVALRRLRSAFSLFGRVIDDERKEELREELRRISGDVLGQARDLDVFVAKRLDALRVSDEVKANIRAQREQAFDAAITALDSARFRALMLDLAEWIAAGPWLRDEAMRAEREMPLADFAAAALDRYWRKVRKGGRNLAALDDEARHDVRIAAKKLRYGAEFFGPLFTGKKAVKRREAFLRALEALQEELGHLNDAATARLLCHDIAAHAGGTVAADDLLGADAGDAVADRDALLAGAEASHRALVDAGRFWR